MTDYPDGMEHRYCEEHDLMHVKDAMGNFICPFCEGEY